MVEYSDNKGIDPWEAQKRIPLEDRERYERIFEVAMMADQLCVCNHVIADHLYWSGNTYDYCNKQTNKQTLGIRLTI